MSYFWVRCEIPSEPRRASPQDSNTAPVMLPVVPVGPSEDEVVRPIAEASRAFYQELLELAEG